MKLREALRPARLLAPVALVAAAIGSGCNETPVVGVGDASVYISADGAVGFGFTTNTLQANGSLEHPEAATVTFGDWSWTLNGIDAGISTPTVDSSLTTRDQVWQVSGVATVDGVPQDRVFSDPITIVNHTPLIPQPAIFPQSGPGVVCADDDLQMVSDTSDPDGDTLTNSYRWTVNGVEVSTAEILPSSETAVFDNVAGSLTVDDGFTQITVLVPTHFVSPGTNCTGPPAPALAGLGVQPAAAAPAIASTRDSRGAEGAATGSVSTVTTVATPAISVSENGRCEIAPDGRLTCADGVGLGLDDVPDGAFSLVRVSLDYACALSAGDGQIVCWGDPLDDFGQLEPPSGAFSTIELATGTACGLRVTGEIACWGNDADGRTDAPDGEYEALDVSETWACAVDRGGDVACWGSGS